MHALLHRINFMRINSGLLAVLFLTFICILRADTSVVWSLEGAAKVGGHATAVYGAPQSVNDAGVKTLVFNGASDGLLVPANPLAGWAAFTIEVLIKPDGSGNEEQRFMHIQDSREARIMIETRVTKDRQWALDTFLFADKDHNHPLLDKTILHPTDQWHWVALVYDGKRMTNYINGIKELEGEVAFPPMLAGQISIGVRQNLVYWYKGAIREVRFHPVALAPSALQRVAVK